MVPSRTLINLEPHRPLHPLPLLLLEPELRHDLGWAPRCRPALALAFSLPVRSLAALGPCAFVRRASGARFCAFSIFLVAARAGDSQGGGGRRSGGGAVDKAAEVRVSLHTHTNKHTRTHPKA